MNLIDKYVTEVGKHLPKSQRADIQAEIRSTLQDMLEERHPGSGPADEAQAIELLKEYGEPRKVAESYIGPRFLIGPRIYPLFELVTKIVLSVVIGIAVVGLGIRLAGSSLVGIEFLTQLSDSALGLLGSLVAVFGNIVIVFAILERVLPASEFEESGEWDPGKLASEPDPDQVSLFEQIVGILFLVLFLFLFNVYSDVFRFEFLSGSERVFIPFRLSDAFFTYLPWINVLFLLEIAMALYLIRKGVWSVTSRVANIVINLAGIGLAVAMLRGPALLDLRPENLAGTSLAEGAEALTQVGEWIPAIVLIIVIIISGIEVAQMAFRLFSIRYQTR